MTRADQKRIVKQMLKGLRETLLEDLPKVPETWSGFELRQWIADTARDRYAIHASRWPNPRGMQEYRNERAVRNL